MSEEKGLVKQSNQLGFVSQALESLDSALAYAEGIVATKVLPKHYYDQNGNAKEGSAQSALLVIQMGNEVGMSTLQAIQQIVPVNNTLSIKGDGAKALIMGSKLCSSWVEEEIGEGDKFGYRITAVRKDTNEKKTVSFTIEDAKRAGLWISLEAATKNEKLKYGPWYKYPKRMLRYRALGFIARDLFSDVLQGMVTLEEAEDYGRESTKVEVVTESGAPITTNADTSKQEGMADQAISKSAKRNAPPAGSPATETKQPVIEDAVFTEVKKEEPAPVAEKPVAEKPKKAAPTKKAEVPAQPAQESDAKALAFKQTDPSKMMNFVSGNKEWVIAYLDKKLGEQGFVDCLQWFEIAKVQRTLAVVAEMLVYLRDSTYEQMCKDKFASMVPAPVQENPGFEEPVEEEPKEEVPTQTKSGYVIPAPFRDFDAQMLVMDYIGEKNKDSNDLQEFALQNGFETGQSLLENGSIALIDAFLLS